MNNIKRVLVAAALAGTALSFTGAAQADDNPTVKETLTIDNETKHDVTEAGVVSDALDSLGLQ
ncbi:hypothetical protein AB0D54_28115 [Streptomyces xanthophaeus]|uniref:hypothetical protein n=1 Tax=Streptomyces xanthophaeus TaxID=67385 RepID=UPI00341CB08A